MGSVVLKMFLYALQTYLCYLKFSAVMKIDCEKTTDHKLFILLSTKTSKVKSKLIAVL